MAEIHMHKFRTLEKGDRVAIVGFPGLGLVSSIATNYLSRELKMDLVAGLTSPEFPPYTLLQAGTPMPQIRLFSHCRKDCKEGIGCENIVVVTTEFAPKIEDHYDVAIALLDWFQKNFVDTIITLDGIPMFVSDRYEILGAASNPKTRESMIGFGVQPFDDGMIRGISGLLLYEGSRRGLNVMSIMGSAKSELPDPKGAANLLEPIKKMFPEMKFSTEPLYEEAEELDRRFRHEPPKQNNDMIYG